MSNSAVITGDPCLEQGSTGIYLHWNGGTDEIWPLCAYARIKGISGPYLGHGEGFTDLCQIIGNWIGRPRAMRIGDVAAMDTNNTDHGCYIIDRDLNIRARLFTGDKICEDGWENMVLDIDSKQPEQLQIGEYFRATPTPIEKLDMGDRVCSLFDGTVFHGTVIATLDQKRIPPEKMTPRLQELYRKAKYLPVILWHTKRLCDDITRQPWRAIPPEDVLRLVSADHPLDPVEGVRQALSEAIAERGDRRNEAFEQQLECAAEMYGDKIKIFPPLTEAPGGVTP